MPASLARTAVLTLLTLVAFAGNSILCRLALHDNAIDAPSFTALRLASGAVALLPLLARRHAEPRPWSPRAACALLVYAIAFSLAYVSLDTGTGALLLFGLVQVTMIGAGLWRGERPSPAQALGIIAAIAGVIVLVLPGVTAPDPAGAVLMATAGVAWGVYSLLGRGTVAPVAATASNFVLAAPLAVVIAVVIAVAARSSAVVTLPGAGYAIGSGAVTSGFGYVIWYAALRGHSATSAAVVQLAVPLLAALGGIAFLNEEPTERLAAASVLTLGGVGLAVTARGGRGTRDGPDCCAGR